MNHPNHHHAPQFAPDFLIDGYIAYTFKPQNAEGYLVHLFNVNAASVHHQSGAFYALNHPVHNIPPAHFVNGQDAWLLDYVVRAGGSVVPQEPWSPQGQGDRRRYVIQAQFRMPVFFVDSDGNLGVPVMNAAAGLHGAGLPPQLVDKTSIKIHIGWPGYATSEHQVQLKDQKPEKNPFTFDRFVKHVGSRVQTFLGACEHAPVQPQAFDWRVAHDNITSDDVMLIGIVQVSEGSWMPILQLKTRVVL